MKYLFVGQVDFGNRGCEALIRSITHILRDADPEAQLLCPSGDIEADRRQWPEAEQSNVHFVPPSLFPSTVKWWGRLERFLPFAADVWQRPRFTPDASTCALVNQADAIIVTGGDILGLEYGRPSLYHWMGLIDWAIDRGKPAHLWAASVGPFTKDPLIERQIVQHLNRYESISVRESATFDYLQSLGVDAVELVTDPAFIMKPEIHDLVDVLHKNAEAGILGFNVSPLVRSFLLDEESKIRFDDEIISFLQKATSTYGFSILLVPHVDPYDGSTRNSDSAYMQDLAHRAGLSVNELTVLPKGLNAAQLKHALSLCRFFMGARTHATIGALSMGVPTISISYSVKARGINRDLFGHEDVVLPSREVSEKTLLASLDLLLDRESEFREVLSKRIPAWRARALLAAVPVTR